MSARIRLAGGVDGQGDPGLHLRVLVRRKRDPFQFEHVRGFRDLNQAKQFYREGLGWPIQQEQGSWVCFSLGNGSCALGLYPWDALADDAGVAANGSGLRGITLSYIVRSEERVDAVLAEAERAGGKIAKPAQRAPWGGYFGYFTDPDGYLWKVAAGAGFAAE